MVLRLRERGRVGRRRHLFWDRSYRYERSFFWLHLGGETWYLEYSAFVAQATVCAVTPIETSRRIELTTKHYAPLIARTRSFFLLGGDCGLRTNGTAHQATNYELGH